MNLPNITVVVLCRGKVWSPLFSRVSSNSEDYLASYPVGTEDSFSGGKLAGAWNWPHRHMV